MPNFTPRRALPKPVGGDGVSELRIAIGAIADAVDGDTMFSSGTLASRPVSTSGTPGIAGRQYLVEGDSTTANNGIVWEDTGTSWFALNLADQAAGVPSQRTLGTGSGQALPGNYPGLTKVSRQYHSFTTDDQTSPNSAASVLGSFFIDPASTETVKLVEAVVHCTAVGSTPSVFKVQTDHGAHGTLANVTGLTTLTPSTSATSVVVSGGLTLSAFDRVCVVVVTAGNSLGCTVQLVTEHTV